MHPALLKSSGWRYSGRARELFAARWAGVLDKWDDLPAHRRVDILALYEIDWRVDAVNTWEAFHKPQRGKIRA